MTNISLSGLSTQAKLLPFHRVLICGTHILPQLCQFWDTFQMELTDESPYKASIGSMRPRLSELQESNNKTRKIKAEGLKDAYEEVDGVLHHQGLPFVPEANQTELINWHYNNPLAGNFGIDKTRELIGRKYYWPSLRRDVKGYIRGYDVYLTLKAVRHKPYYNLPSLPILTYQ